MCFRCFAFADDISVTCNLLNGISREFVSGEIYLVMARESYVLKQTIFLTHFTGWRKCQQWINGCLFPTSHFSADLFVLDGECSNSRQSKSAADQFVDYCTACDITVVTSRPIYGRAVESEWLMDYGRCFRNIVFRNAWLLMPTSILAFSGVIIVSGKGDCHIKKLFFVRLAVIYNKTPPPPNLKTKINFLFFYCHLDKPCALYKRRYFPKL